MQCWPDLNPCGMIQKKQTRTDQPLLPVAPPPAAYGELRPSAVSVAGPRQQEE